jgi:hypothetical protein
MARAAAGLPQPSLACCNALHAARGGSTVSTVSRPLPPAVTVVSAAEASAVLALSPPDGVLLLSAEGAGGFLGAAGWRALVTAAGGGAPDALCCAGAPGDALLAIRAGCRIIVLDGRLPAFGAVHGAAREAGALLLPARPPSLAVRSLNLAHPAGRARLADWLRAGPAAG